MKVILICSFFALSISKLVSADTWTLFKSVHGKVYRGDEDSLRRENFERNVKLIAGHNVQADLGIHLYRLGVNHFSDWTKLELEQFKQTQLTHVSNLPRKEKHFKASIPIPVPDSFDWRPKGVVSPVPSIAREGVPAIFSAVGAIESSVAILRKQGVVELSTQQVYECSDLKNTDMTPVGVYGYLIQSAGLETEANYPSGGPVCKCQFNDTKVAVKVKAFGQLPPGLEDALKVNIALFSPTTVMVDGESFNFLFYKNGIYSDSKCNATNVNLAMLAVGYGSSDGTDFWSLKNVWGQDWGEHGYMRLARNSGNMCGVATFANSPYVQPNDDEL